MVFSNCCILFPIQIFLRSLFFWVQFSLENTELEQHDGDSFMSLPIRVSAHYRRGAPLCSMTSSRLLRAEAEPLGLRATCVQRVQLQNCFIPFSIE